MQYPSGPELAVRRKRCGIPSMHMAQRFGMYTSDLDLIEAAVAAVPSVEFVEQYMAICAEAEQKLKASQAIKPAAPTRPTPGKATTLAWIDAEMESSRQSFIRDADKHAAEGCSYSSYTHNNFEDRIDQRRSLTKFRAAYLEMLGEPEPKPVDNRLIVDGLLKAQMDKIRRDAAKEALQDELTPQPPEKSPDPRLPISDDGLTPLGFYACKGGCYYRHKDSCTMLSRQSDGWRYESTWVQMRGVTSMVELQRLMELNAGASKSYCERFPPEKPAEPVSKSAPVHLPSPYDRWLSD